MLRKFTKAQIYILILTVVMLILFLLPWKKIMTQKTEVVFNELDQSKRIELLESKIKKFQVQQIVFDSTFTTMTDSIVSLQYEIEKKELQILNLKRKKHETNTVVRNFNDTDVIYFFSKRYK